MIELYIGSAAYVGLTIWLTIKGKKRKIGAIKSLLLCLFLTPLLGSLFVFNSQKSISYFEERFCCPRCKYEFNESKDFCPLCEKEGEKIPLEVKRKMMT